MVFFKSLKRNTFVPQYAVGLRKVAVGLGKLSDRVRRVIVEPKKVIDDQEKAAFSDFSQNRTFTKVTFPSSTAHFS